MTSSNGNIFRVTGRSGEFPAQRPVTWSFDIFFDLRPNSARINGWVNNRDAGDLKLHRDHYDITVMNTKIDHQIRQRLKQVPPVEIWWNIIMHLDFSNIGHVTTFWATVYDGRHTVSIFRILIQEDFPWLTISHPGLSRINCWVKRTTWPHAGQRAVI